VAPDESGANAQRASTALNSANPANKTVGQQSVTIGPGDGACVELLLREPGIYPAVNHAFGHAQHGAIALLQAA
jgi:nitrite reductase (NO-forming)